MTGNDGEGGQGSIKEQKMLTFPKKLRLHVGDHPGMSLVIAPFDGRNYLSWSRSIKLALGAKHKLDFIDGTCKKPEKGKDEMEQWERVDCMSRFGGNNGPMLYEIQRKIASLTQGDMSISGYYTKLKKLWDELAHFTTLPQCSCGSSKAIAELNASSKLLQVFMGLGDSYDHCEEPNTVNGSPTFKWKGLFDDLDERRSRDRPGK
ncbi:UNVERIFIED_CONTAM: hypothetical protein Slati_3445900 [Sesamum latifolium]|uniref:Retrotransposon Copia-like N-terminal domain-containing protein n=1 Tax=Sesamum latifolium TaxID=2727402 RepID=A0AAW2UFN4_9LAMI